MVLADGVHLNAIAIYQGVEVPLMDQGAPVHGTVPVVAGRAATLRAFVTLDDDHDGGEVTARLTLAGEIYETTTVIEHPSSKQSLSSTINFDIAGDALQGSVDWHIELLKPTDQSSGGNADARWPQQGDAQLGASGSGARLSVVLVPLSYQADGSGRLPDVSQEQITLYRERLYATYPVAGVDIEVREPFAPTTALHADGDGWDALLNTMLAYRESIDVEPDQYVYGLVSPAASYDAYCPNGCVTGLSFLSTTASDNLRVGIGLGFSGEESAAIAVHELGHMHGRDHAPCGATDVDPAYPHADGQIGTWGLDIVSGRVYAPDAAVDFMSYCSPTWVSDYTFAGLFEHITQVDGQGSPAVGEKSYRVSGIRQGALPIDLDTMLMMRPLRGDSQLVGGRHGHYFGYSHLPGGVLLSGAGDLP